MYYDSHCHLDFDEFAMDRDDVFRRARANGVSRWMVAGVQAEHWSRQRQLARCQSGCDWAVGIHPQYVDQYGATEWSSIIADVSAAFDRKTPPKAVGEIGLHRVPSLESTTQVIRFEQQLEVARMRGVPIILHVVGTHAQVLSILQRHGPLVHGGVVHGFTGSKEVAQAYVKLNLHLGISGRWVRGGAKKLQSTIQSMDLSRLLLESDAPDQSPNVGFRNESTIILEAAEWIAKRKGLTKKAVLVQCSKNALRLFC